MAFVDSSDDDVLSGVEIYLALAFVLGVVVFGSVGYVVVEGYSWVEALYMTVITVSTVGFGRSGVGDGGVGHHRAHHGSIARRALHLGPDHVLCERRIQKH